MRSPSFASWHNPLPVSAHPEGPALTAQPSNRWRRQTMHSSRDSCRILNRVVVVIERFFGRGILVAKDFLANCDSPREDSRRLLIVSRNQVQNSQIIEVRGNVWALRPRRLPV